MTEVDQFTNWRRRLAGDKSVMTYETEPDPGYYRRPIVEKTPGGASKKVGWEAVAFWYEDDTLFCRIGNRIPLVQAQAGDIWLWVAKYPITEEVYFDVVDNGAAWPDMPHEPLAQPAVAPPVVTGPVGEVLQGRREGDGYVFEAGHNNPPEDPLAAMREQIDSAIGASKALTVTTMAEAELAQASRSRLLDLSNNADKVRKAEKAPHETAAKAVDAKYMPMVKSAKEAADSLRAKLSDYATAQAKAAREQQARDDVARRAEEDAARARAQAERDRLDAMAKGEEPKPLPPAPQPVTTAAPAITSTIKGASGKAAGVEMVKFAVVADWAALATHYCGKEEVRDLLQKLANKDVKAGMFVPGVEVDERADVR